jgi:trans-aconitate methyltransferase
MDYAERGQLNATSAAAHWYYRAKFGLLAAHLRSELGRMPALRLADVGCGLGVFLTLIEQAGLVPPGRMVGIDPAAEPGAWAAGGRTALRRDWPEGARYEALVAMDVLEHVDDDAALARELRGRAAPGGSLFVTVPALPWLWSAHDEVLGHRRRYRLGDLVVLLRDAGWRVERAHYYYGAILPGVAAVRLWRRRRLSDRAGSLGAASVSPALRSDLCPVPGWLNATLRAVLAVERPLARWNRLAGVSAVAVARA